MIRKAIGLLRKLSDALKKKRTFYISPTSGRAALHDEETDIVDLGDGTYARMSDIESYYKLHYRWNPFSDEEDVSFHGSTEQAAKFWAAYTRAKQIEFFKQRHR